MRNFYIALVSALILTLNSIMAVAWAVHYEKTIAPGESVTIHCGAEPEPVVPEVSVCDTGELVISPAICPEY